MKLIFGILGGAIAGVIGAIIWAAVVHYTHYEIGIIAWGIGAMVGVGVLIGSGREGGVPMGVAAAIIALGAILLGKWMWVLFIVGNPYNEEAMISEVADIIIEERVEANQPVSRPRLRSSDDSLRSAYSQDVWLDAEQRWNSYSPAEQAEFRAAPALLNPQLYMVFIADDVANEFTAEGRTIEWPKEYDTNTAWRRSHYPADVWAEAERRWNAFSPAEQEQHMQWLTQTQQEYHRHMMASVQPTIFQNTFSLFDLLWVVLAVATGFKIAAANESEPAPDAQ